ncbi:MAG: hypothetical protein IJS39_13830, partial [Synergistaceae bacterium]|nr:hypothetical protein [Synergistaceae bacterium]
MSVAVGDFVGSGTTDQIAFTTASSAGITMTVCKIEKDSSGNYSYREIVTENCCTYTGPMKDGYVGGRPDFYPAADTVAGDFDGDGNTEIAVVFKDDKPHSDDPDKLVFGQLNITIFKWDSDSGSFSKGANSIAVNYYNVYSYNYFATYRVNLLGLKAARADWNGEGKDGIAVLFFGHYSSEYEYDHGHYDYEQVCPYFMYWYCDEYTINPKQATFDTNNNQYFDGWGIRYGPLNDHGTPSQCIFGDKTENEEGTFYYFNQNGTKHGVPLHGYFPYVDRTFSLASGPFTGQLGTLKMIDDLAVSWSGIDGHDPRADYGHAYIFKVNHNPATATGQFIGVSTGKEVLSVYNSASTYRLALVGADFLGEGVELEEPVHLKTEGDRTYAAILQTPPYHVDYIPVPWGDEPTTPALTNFTYTEDLKSEYDHESSSETGQDVNFDMKGSAETIESLGTGEVSSTYVKIASFALEKAGAKDAGAVLGMLTDKVETTKSEANQSSISMALTDRFETSTSDRVLYYSSNVHTWRYPIKEPAPDWLFANLIEGDPSSASGDKFLTFSMADDPVSHATAGLEDDCYQPLHEEGNLFSYPTNLAQIPGYQNRQLTLTDQSSITYSPGSYSRSITVTKEA